MFAHAFTIINQRQSPSHKCSRQPAQKNVLQDTTTPSCNTAPSCTVRPLKLKPSPSISTNFSISCLPSVGGLPWLEFCHCGNLIFRPPLFHESELSCLSRPHSCLHVYSARTTLCPKIWATFIASFFRPSYPEPFSSLQVSRQSSVFSLRFFLFRWATWAQAGSLYCQGLTMGASTSGKLKLGS